MNCNIVEASIVTSEIVNNEASVQFHLTFHTKEKKQKPVSNNKIQPNGNVACGQKHTHKTPSEHESHTMVLV